MKSIDRTIRRHGVIRTVKERVPILELNPAAGLSASGCLSVSSDLLKPFYTD